MGGFSLGPHSRNTIAAAAWSVKRAGHAPAGGTAGRAGMGDLHDQPSTDGTPISVAGGHSQRCLVLSCVPRAREGSRRWRPHACRLTEAGRPSNAVARVAAAPAMTSAFAPLRPAAQIGHTQPRRRRRDEYSRRRKGRCRPAVRRSCANRPFETGNRARCATRARTIPRRSDTALSPASRDSSLRHRLGSEAAATLSAHTGETRIHPAFTPVFPTGAPTSSRGGSH